MGLESVGRVLFRSVKTWRQYHTSEVTMGKLILTC
jgi:hypothetical protein